MDWSAVDALTDEQIEAAVAKDADAAPILGESWFKDAELVVPGRKRAISIRFDPEVMDYFTAGGPGYQSRMNAVLLRYVRHQRALEIAQRLNPAGVKPTADQAALQVNLPSPRQRGRATKRDRESAKRRPR